MDFVEKKQKGLTRRDFVKGTAAGAVGGMVAGAAGAGDVSAPGPICTVCAAVKAAQVEPIRMHLAFGIGGKSYVILTGEVADVIAATKAGAAVASERGFLVSEVVIPRPHQQLIDQLL